MILFAIFWVLCSILTYGYSFAYYQNRFPLASKTHYKLDMIFCIFMSVIQGPVGLLTFRAGVGSEAFKYGFRIR